jgi:hypothetical protein
MKAEIIHSRVKILSSYWRLCLNCSVQVWKLELPGQLANNLVSAIISINHLLPSYFRASVIKILFSF